MSCNGCRVLRKGCSESCILRPCLEWIQSPEAQGNATLFVSKFYGRGDLLAFIKAVPENRRAALFQSLLFEACGRIVNPVNGAVGLLTTGNWHVCQAAVETVLAGGGLRRMVVGIQPPDSDEGSEEFLKNSFKVRKQYASELEAKHQSSRLKISATADRGGRGRNYPAARQRRVTESFDSGESEVMTCFESSDSGVEKLRGKEPKLLNLFV